MVSLKNYASIYVFVKTDAVLYHGRLPVSRLRVMLHADWYDSGSEAVCSPTAIRAGTRRF